MRVLVLGGHGKVALPLVLDLEARSDDALRHAVAGYDALVWSAGAGGGDASRTYAVDRDAAIRTMDAAEAAGVRRFVMVSWIGSVPDHGVDPDSSFFAYADAKLAADDHLRGSGLAWTILGPGTLTLDPPTGRIDVHPGPDASVPRADVAAAVVGALDDDATVGEFIRFGSGDVPIAEALRSGGSPAAERGE
jgi:uncharacterized protein YbjT (DUF2867 family)